MALLDRVTTLIKANLNDLVDKAEDPEKLLKQLLLDMQNQFMQVKTQVAIAIADRHLLEKKQQESLNAHKEWLRKAELAVSKNEDQLARIAVERSLTHEQAATNFAQQIENQALQVQTLRDALYRLEQMQPRELHASRGFVRRLTIVRVWSGGRVRQTVQWLWNRRGHGQAGHAEGARAERSSAR